MTRAENGFDVVDLGFQGAPSVIATAVLGGRDGVALVDPGPTTCLERLKAGLSALGTDLREVTALLLTHIHLDHAGASGAILRERPDVTVYVHERGAKHLVDPAKLLDSASRLYGDAMARLWGAVLPVPAANVRALAGGERIEAGGRQLAVAYTPGHASHHVTYFDAEGGTAFVGDTAGVRIGPGGLIMPPTPPPDIDLDAWQASADRILAWRPARLFLTHFGLGDAPASHFGALMTRLRHTAELARTALEAGGSDADQARVFQDAARAELRAHATEAEVAQYELAVPLDHCYLGLARYWRKRAAS
jgi:glyoxylase-like metal-dependent hydrolase (beta-lactamase superfamily II)